MKKIKGLLLLALLLGGTSMATKVEADASGAPYIIKTRYGENAWCTFRTDYYSNGDKITTLLSCITGGSNPYQ